MKLIKTDTLYTKVYTGENDTQTMSKNNSDLCSFDSCVIRKSVENPNYLVSIKTNYDFSNSTVLLSETAVREISAQLDAISLGITVEEIAQRIERNLKCSVEIMDNSQEVEMMADYLLNLYGSDGLHAPDNLHLAFSIVHKTTLFSCDYKLINVCKKNNTPCINTHKLATGEGIRVVKSKYAKIVKTFKPKIQSSLLKPGEKIVWRSFV
tara:strand:+ start:75 stop:701 length:627 start_codon:yes stop_codon:yes gene_type:complete